VAEGDGEEQATGDAAATPTVRQRHGGSADVFISYTSADKQAADSICAALERGGILCWIAPRDVTPGVFYADAIVEAINSARILIVVLSVNSVGSQHVLREVERASAKRRPLVAIRLDTTPLPTGLEYFLSASHWLDASGGTIERALPELVTAVRRLLLWPATPGGGVIPPADGVGGTTAIRESTQKPSWKRLWVATAAAVLLLAVLVGKVWLSNRSAMQNTTTPVATVIPATVPAASTISEKSIAVLPFTDMSEKHDQEYFGDGMAEEILDLLAKVPGLTVIGRTSSFQFKGKNEDLRTIGTKLNAAYVLEGSVRNSGDKVRITAQLINTRTGAHEWSETYDRHIGDVLKLQDAIAATVVRELQITIAPDYMTSRSTLKSAEVYDLYLRGRHASDRGDKEGLDEAVTLFQQALDRDPTSADAAAGLAFAYYFQGSDNFLAPAAAFEQARSAAALALKLDPKNVLAHTVLGNIHLLYDWDWAAAAREFQRVSTLAPNSAYALTNEAWLSLALGRWDDALRQIKAAVAQDPLNPDNFENLTYVQMRRGRLPEAEAAIRRALEIRPTYGWGHYLLGLVLLERGDRDAALVEMQQETSDDGRETGLAIVYHALGRKTESDAVLARLIKEYADGSAFEIALVYGFRGQSDEAMHWLERAYVQKDAALFQVKSYLPLKSLAGDPRFKAFLKKMNLPE
jgi:TolB-like protein/Flp pilus assembly protein TadD